MQFIAKKTSSLQLLLFLVLGSALGYSISIIGNLPNNFLMVAIVGISFPFIAFMIGDVRKFLITMTAVVLPIRVDVNFMHIFENQAGAHTAGISILDIFVIFLFILWLVEGVTRGTEVHFFKGLTIPAILYLEACVLTLIWAPRIDLATMEIIRMVKLLILFFVLANQIRDKQDLKLVVWGLALSVGFEGLLALLQTIKGGTLGLHFLGEAYIPGEVNSSMWRVMGTLGHPNRLAQYLEILLPVCFGFFLVEKKTSNKIFLMIIFGLGIIAIISTGSRGSWIGFAIAMIILFFFAIKHKQMKISTLIGTGLIGLIIISAAAFAFTDMIQHRLYGDDHGSAMSRIPMIQIAFNLIKAHPVGGVGINNYQVEMKKYNDTILGRRFRTIPRPVHNMYLLVTGETGIIGFTALMSLLVMFSLSAIKNIRAADPLISVMNAAVFGGFVAMLVHGLVDKHAPGGYPLFYVLMAIIAASGLLIKKDRQTVQEQQ